MLTCRCGSQALLTRDCIYRFGSQNKDEGEFIQELNTGTGYKQSRQSYLEDTNLVWRDAQDYRERRRRENYEAMSDEAKLWHDAVGSHSKE